jgi:hypothetical protein
LVLTKRLHLKNLFEKSGPIVADCVIEVASVSYPYLYFCSYAIAAFDGDAVDTLTPAAAEFFFI